MQRFPTSVPFRVAALLALVLPSLGLAQSRPTGEPTSRPVTVDLKDLAALKAAMGSEVVVTGKVASAEWSSTGRVMRIEFEGTEKSQFYAVLFPKQRPEFDAKYGGDVTKAMGGAEVRITGKLQLYRERPEIILNRLDQLEVTKKG